MHLNEHIQVRGCFTQEKYIKGRTSVELEKILGFNIGRLQTGFVVAALEQIPNNDQFELLGYTQVAEHRFGADALKGLDINKLKDNARQMVFTNAGIDRLVKILPNTPHQLHLSNEEQYPPGLGVPQWKLTSPLYAKVVRIVGPGERYT